MENQKPITINIKKQEEETFEPEQFEDENEIETVILEEIGENEDNTSNHKIQLFKTMGDKQIYAFKQLVVPTSMRSIYWKFFGFPASDEGDILTKIKIVCTICRAQIAYNRNTSNLRMHLQNKHLQELNELEAASPPRKQIVSQETKEKRAQKRILKAALANVTPQHVYTTNVDGTVQVDNGIQFLTNSNVNITGNILTSDGNINKPIKLIVKSNDVSNITNQNVTFLVPQDSSTNNQDHNKEFYDTVAEFIIMDLQLPEIVQGSGFQRLISKFNSPCEIPTKLALETEIIPRIYDQFKDSIVNIISSLNSEISLAVEEWKSNYGVTFFTFIIYYKISDEANLESKILTTLHAPADWSQEQWSVEIDLIFNDWFIKVEKITGVIAGTDRTELLSALTSKGISVVPCLLHILKTGAQACFKNCDVSKIIAKCRYLIGTIVNQPSVSSVFSIQEQIHEVDDNFLTLDNSSIWLSTYKMLTQIHKRKNILKSILESIEEIDCDEIDLSENEWLIIEDLINVLDPFKVIIITLSEEKMPLLSLLKPLLWQLISSHLKINELDSITTQHFKESLSAMLREKYSDSGVNLMLQIATHLDPRFKEVPYATDEDKKMITTSIKEILIKVINEEEEEEELASKEEEGSSAKKSRQSGIGILLGNMQRSKKEMSTKEKADLELALYQSEATAALDCCPLQWWEKTSVKCPNLGKIANRYNCVPVCCIPPARIPFEIQMTYNSKRAALPPSLANKLLFLHDNYTLL